MTVMKFKIKNKGARKNEIKMERKKKRGKNMDI